MTTLAEALKLKIEQQSRTKDEPVHLNQHYKKGAMQPWDIIDEWQLDFYEGNVLKYLLRAKHKGSQLDDYIKAKHYLQRLIETYQEKVDNDQASW